MFLINFTNYYGRPLNITSANQQQQQQQQQIHINQLIEKYEDRYKKLRDFILIKGIIQIKDELTPLLYYIYLFFFFELQKQIPDYAYRFLRSHKEDFCSFSSFLKQISYLETLIKIEPNEQIKTDIWDKVSKTDPIIKEILDNKIVIMTQFTHDIFQMFLNKNDLKDLYTILSQNLNITIKISKDPIIESSLQSNVIVSSLNLVEIDRINQATINLAPIKDDVSLMNKLDSIYNAQKKVEQQQYQNINSNLPSKKLKEKLIDIEHATKDENVLEKSSIPLPEIKPRSRIDFIKNYLERQYLSDYSEPSIMSININDPYEYATCVDIEKNGNIILFGFNDSTILLFSLNQSFEYTNFLEKNKKKVFHNIKKNIIQPSNSANIMDEEFTFGLSEKNKEDGKDKSSQNNENNYDAGNGNNFDMFIVEEFIGHEDAITSVSLLYDELYFISSSIDTTIRLWCIRQRTCLSIFRGHVNTVWKVKFSPRAYYFASGSSDCTARLWTTDKTHAVRIFTGHTADVHLLEFSENVNFLITASHDKSIRIWDILSGSCMKILFPGNESISSLSLSHSGKYLATGSENGLVILWNMENCSKISHFFVDTNKRILGLTFSIDEVYLAGACKNRISYFLIDKLKNEKGDMLHVLQRANDLNNIKDDKINDILSKKDNLAINYFENQETDMLFIKFGVSNFLYAIGRMMN